MASEQEPETPKDIKFETLIEDVCFHPTRDLIATGLIEGPVTLHSYSTTEKNHLLMNLNHHKKACRALRFSPTGEVLMTASKDKSIQMIDLNKGAVKQALKKAHESALYSLLVVDDNIMASGDDDGVLKVWDLRQQKAVMESKQCQEFISDMAIERNKRLLLVTSGEGTLSAFDIRKHKLKVQSELFDSEFLSLVMVKNEQKVVCGNGEGILNIFNWGEWGNISDRFPGHPESIDCMIALNEDVIVTGSMDGIVRAVNIHPNRFIGVVGEHEEFPIENMTMSRCKKLLASCSHDQCVKFWDLSDVLAAEVDETKKAPKAKKNKPIKQKGAKNDFFADLVEPSEAAAGDGDSDDDSDDSDSDYEVPQKKAKKHTAKTSEVSTGEKSTDGEKTGTGNVENKCEEAESEGSDGDDEGEDEDGDLSGVDSSNSESDEEDTGKT